MVDQATHDYVTWRTELESVEDLGAFGTLERNLITGQGGGERFEMGQVAGIVRRVLVLVVAAALLGGRGPEFLGNEHEPAGRAVEIGPPLALVERPSIRPIAERAWRGSLLIGSRVRPVSLHVFAPAGGAYALRPPVDTHPGIPLA